jgi:hypothetical protein
LLVKTDDPDNPVIKVPVDITVREPDPKPKG